MHKLLVAQVAERFVECLSSGIGTAGRQLDPCGARTCAMESRLLDEPTSRARSARTRIHIQIVEHPRAARLDGRKDRVELNEPDEPPVRCTLGDEDDRFPAPQTLREIAPRERNRRRLAVELAIGVKESRELL